MKIKTTPKRIPPPTTATLCCVANLDINGFDVTGIDTAVGLSTAFALDIGKIWVFFSTPMENLNYSWNVNSNVGRARVSDRTVDYIEISVEDKDDLPIEVSVVSVQLFKAV